jgi:hypothetical protein
MFPQDNPTSAPIILSCWFWSNGWQEGRIEEARAASQTAVITPRGSLAAVTVEFKRIHKVALSYGYTENIEYFGSPRNMPILASLPASTYAEVL